MSASTPVTTHPGIATLLRPSAFLNRLIALLLPHFVSVCHDIDEARSEIVETLASYGACTRPELLNAARILAYSLAGLDLLNQARITEMTPQLRLRCHGSANSLDRTSQQNEQMLTKRLAVEPSPEPEPPVEPVEDDVDPELDKQIREVHAILKSRGYPLRGSQSEAPPTPSAAMMQALAASQLPIPPPPDHFRQSSQPSP